MKCYFAPGIWSRLACVAAALGIGLLTGACASPPVASRAKTFHAAGAPATQPAEAGGAMLRVMTWNIHGDGEDTEAELRRIADVIAVHRPDLVALQEVDRGTDRAGRVDQARRLGEMTGMRHAFAPFEPVDGGETGLAVLSRHPVEAAEPLEMPDSALEPDVALLVRVAPPGARRPVTFVCVHFDFVPAVGGRMAQARKLVEHLGRIDGPVVVAGDFNSTPAEGEVKLMLEHLNPVLKPDDERFTFSSSAPRREIDYVFYRPAGVLAARGSRAVDGRRASDHRPVLAEFEYVTAPATGPATARRSP
jgi:endonuclease/exonuclease/phosphatase family metal-dependent hydrolase